MSALQAFVAETSNVARDRLEEKRYEDHMAKSKKDRAK